MFFKQPRFWIFLFGLLCLINLSAEFIGQQWLIFASKPLLMIVLSIYFYLSVHFSEKYFKYILGGFIFSFLGDTFLMFVENDPAKNIFFLLGLGSFLITHFFYFLAFWNIPKAKSEGLLIQKKWLLLPFIIYLIGNSIFLWKDIPADLQIAVVVYSTMIVTMTSACINSQTVLPKYIFKTLLIGVLLFVLSDSIIGLNKFKSQEFPLPYPRLLIMIPYLLSQYWIAKGSIKYYNYLQK